MKHSSEIVVAADPTTVGDVLADLDTYPHWNSLVADVVADGGDADLPAWLATLRAQVGPFARSKRLRLVRAHDQAQPGGARAIRFERLEIDGREHASWVMEASVEPDGADAARVLLTLVYDGGLWVSALEPVLGMAIDRATSALPDYVTQREG